jgi:serine/threonine protein kinase
MRRRSKGLPDIRTPRVALTLSFEEIYSFFKDITSGLAYLHSTHHVHRDLKPSNILLHRDGSGFHCLISDFGEVQPENALQISTGATGTISYCAPEVLRQDKSGRYENYTTKSDIFSLGMVLYFICFRRLPYKSANHSEDEEDIDLLREEFISWPGFEAEGGERRERPELPNQLYELLKSLLAIDPANRPSAKEIRESLELEQSIR